MKKQTEMQVHQKNLTRKENSYFEQNDLVREIQGLQNLNNEMTEFEYSPKRDGGVTSESRDDFKNSYHSSIYSRISRTEQLFQAKTYQKLSEIHHGLGQTQWFSHHKY